MSTLGLAGPGVRLEQEGPPDGCYRVTLWPQSLAQLRQCPGRGPVPLSQSPGRRQHGVRGRQGAAETSHSCSCRTGFCEGGTNA